jgi:hypothetical protein
MGFEVIWPVIFLLLILVFVYLLASYSFPVSVKVLMGIAIVVWFYGFWISYRSVSLNSVTAIGGRRR